MAWPGGAPASLARETRTQVVIAVRPPLWAELLGSALEREKDLVVASRVDDEADLMKAPAPCDGVVILLDYEGFGPGCEGLIARLRRSAPWGRVLVLARRSGDETVLAVLRAGAAGLIGKERPFATVLAAIRAVAAGEVWADRQTTAMALRQLVSFRQPDELGDAALTVREWEVVEAVGKGMRNLDIALALGISEKTVKTHLYHIFGKTGVSNRLGLAFWAQGRHPQGH